MNRFVALLTVLLLALPAFVAQAQSDHADWSGSLGEAGYYRFVVPAGWQDGGRVLVWNHGFSMSLVAEDPFRSVAPDEETLHYWLERGYALAAGSYRTRGWALFDIEADQRALLAAFRERVGEPGEILLVGGSLGGLVALRSVAALVEDGDPVAGVYALCPPVAGARTWDRAFEMKLAYDAVCAGVGGGEFARGAEPFSWVIDLADIPDDLGDFLGSDSRDALLAFGARVDQCTGVLRPAVLRSFDQRQRLETLMQAFGLSSEDFFLTNMAYAVFPLADLVRAPDKLAGRNPFDSQPTWRDELGGRVEAVMVDPLARYDLHRASNPRGPWGEARVLVTHTSRDELVIPEHLSALPSLGLAERQLASAMVRENEVGHCGYSRSEFLAGFESLREWIDDGIQPDAFRLNFLCGRINAEGAGDGGRCGYDALLEAGDYDARVRQPEVLDDLATRPGLSGVWWDPQRSGEGLLVEKISTELAALTWFTYPTVDDPEAGSGQRWLAGLGRIRDNAVVVDDVYAYEGGGFGSGYDAGQVEQRRWGSIIMALGDCGEAALRYDSAEAGQGEQRLELYTHIGVSYGDCLGIAASPPPPRSRFLPYSGSWYRGPGQGGEGLFLQSQDGGPLVGIWYTFDAAGRPVHLGGSGREEGNDLVLDLYITGGAVFGVDFDPATVERQFWGSLRLSFASCNSARLRYEPVLSGWEAGELDYVRLTQPWELLPCND